MKEKYGLPTAIAMITGIVIGSGIFFKSYNILLATGGSVPQGVLAFCLCAFGIVFGSLAVAQLAARTQRPGGVITYAEDFCSPAAACGFGWFHTFLYYPSLSAVVAWVAGLYTCALFGWESSLLTQTAIGLGYMTLLFLLNVISARLGGYFQNISTVLKLVPLFIVAVAGLVWGQPEAVLTPALTPAPGGWMAAMGAVAFSFDGWIVATSVAHEIKNSRRNLPLALVVAPLLILACYILYFVGISALMGPKEILAAGPDHAYLAAQMLFGSGGAKVLLVFIIVSVLGTVNGLILGHLRLPMALAQRGMFPGARRFEQSSPGFDINLPGALVSYALCVFWMAVHYITQRWNLLPGSDISEISIVVNYLGYILLYTAVMRLCRKGEIASIWKGYVVPLLAILGSVFILLGGIQNPLFPWYLAGCGLVIAGAMLFYRRRR